MISREQLDQVIDRFSLEFLDEFEAAYKRLPTERELTLWRVGFIDGLNAVGEVLNANRKDMES